MIRHDTRRVLSNSTVGVFDALCKAGFARVYKETQGVESWKNLIKVIRNTKLESEQMNFKVFDKWSHEVFDKEII